MTCQDTSTGETKGATVADDPSAAPAAATEVSEKVRMRNGMEWSNLVLLVVKLCPKIAELHCAHWFLLNIDIIDPVSIVEKHVFAAK